MFFFQTKEPPVVLNSSTVIKSSVKILADLQLSLRSSGTIFTEVQRFLYTFLRKIVFGPSSETIYETILV